jgi:hypothetical protein
VRAETLRRLAQTDWGDAPVLLQFSSGSIADPKEAQTQCALRLLQKFCEGTADYLLFLEDDLEFNRCLRRNLLAWPPLRSRQMRLGSLYNPGVREEACALNSRAYLVSASAIYGSQAFIISREAANFIVDHWEDASGMQDIRISRLAGRLGQPIFYHSPSLVQHVGRSSTWGGPFHESPDFDPIWESGSVNAEADLRP